MSKEVKKGVTPGLPRRSDGDQGRPSDDSDVARQKALAEKIMDDDREVLEELAK